MEIKANFNTYPENETEEKLVQIVRQIRESEEVKAFLANAKAIAEEFPIKDFSTRVKNEKSALRTFRNKKSDDIRDMQDLCGLRIITENEEDIFAIVDKIKKLFTGHEIKEYNLLSSTNRQKELVTGGINIRPLAFNLLVQKDFDGVDETVPIEIVFQDQYRYLAIESTYFSLYKNDQMDTEERKKLLKCMNPIMYLYAQIDMSEKDNPDLEKQFQELLLSQTDSLKGHEETFYSVFEEYSINKFKFINRNRINQEKTLGIAQEQSKTEQTVSEIFTNTLRKSTGTFTEKAIQASKLATQTDYDVVKTYKSIEEERSEKGE